MSAIDDALLLLPDVKTYDAARRELEALRARAEMAVEKAELVEDGLPWETTTGSVTPFNVEGGA